MAQRASINGSDFRPGPDGREASCALYDEAGALVLSTPVEYRPELDASRVACLLAGSQSAIGALEPGGSYRARYVQRGVESAVEYRLLVLARPRLLGLRRRLVSESESIVVTGEGFSPQVGYLCQYREREPRTGHGGDGAAAEFRPLFAPALQVLPTELTCPPVTEAPAYLRPEGGRGFRCLDILIKDPSSGLTFGAEAGSPAETLASACLITSADALLAAGPPVPKSLPLAAAGARTLSPEERELRFALVEGSGILELFRALGEPLASATLRFDGVVVGGARGPELLSRSAAAALDSPVLLEIECAASALELRCAPWPYVTAADPLHLRTALTLSLSAPLSSPGAAIELPLSQDLGFFENIGVEAWSPLGSLLETVHSWVAVSGTAFAESAALECLFFEVGLE